MDKGKALLFSMGAGILLMSFLDFSMPIYISVGLAVFVTILALHDFMGDGLFLYDVLPLTDQSNLMDKIEYFLVLFLSNFGKAMKVFVHLSFILSVPISIYAAYNSHINRTVEEISSAQQSLTLYSLGIVIISISFHKNNTK